MTAQTILPANSATGAFEVSNSLRFDDGTSDNLQLTLGTPTLATKNTVSIWFKRCEIGSQDTLIFGASNAGGVYIHSDDTMRVYNANSAELITTRTFKDVSAWYHVVFATDTTQGTDTNRLKLYINGVQETSFSSAGWPNEDAASTLGGNTQHNIGSNNTPGNYFNGYIAEFIMVDGQALDPTSFGEFDDVTTTVWKPKKILGALNFGDNGFYLQFKQSGTGTNASGMGADTSGNTNHFAVNNLTAVDQSIDTCTNNFCTLNPSQIGPRNNQADSSGTFSEGNLNVLMTGSGDDFAGTIAVSTGKWFYEVKLLTAANHGAGFTLLTDFTGESTVSNGIANGDFQYGSAEGGAGSKIANNGDVSVAPQNNFDDNDIIGFAFDIDGGTLKIYNNGSLDRTISSIPAGTYVPMGGDDSSTDANLAFNFGSPAYAISSGNADGNGYGNFEYAVPSGYFAICTKNLAEYG